jgi:hypothetical protein
MEQHQFIRFFIIMRSKYEPLQLAGTGSPITGLPEYEKKLPHQRARKFGRT